MGRIVLVTMTVLPLIEIALFVVVGRAIGVWPTLLAVLATAALGLIVMRAQGMAIIAEMRETMMRGQLPARGIADGLLVALGGLLLLLPGFFTDAIGLLLLIPPLRRLLYRGLSRHMSVVTTGPAGSGFSAQQPRGRSTIDLDSGEWRHE